MKNKKIHRVRSEIKNSKKHKQTGCGNKTITYGIHYHIHGTNSKHIFSIKKNYAIFERINC